MLGSDARMPIGQGRAYGVSGTLSRCISREG